MSQCPHGLPLGIGCLECDHLRDHLRDEDVSAAFRDALYAHTCRYIATASWGDLHAYLDVLEAAYAARVGEYAPLVAVAIQGIHGPLRRQARREQGLQSPQPIAPAGGAPPAP